MPVADDDVLRDAIGNLRFTEQVVSPHHHLLARPPDNRVDGVYVISEELPSLLLLESSSTTLAGLEAHLIQTGMNIRRSKKLRSLPQNLLQNLQRLRMRRTYSVEGFAFLLLVEVAVFSLRGNVAGMSGGLNLRNDLDAILLRYS